MHKICAFLLLVSATCSTGAVAETVKTLRIDSALSSIQYFEDWFCTDCSQNSYSITGEIKMRILDPDEEYGFGNMRLEKLLFNTEPLPERDFRFPSYYASLRDGIVHGDGNYCSWPGRGASSCYFMVRPGTFDGTFENGVLSISGIDHIFSYDEYYEYSITATVVPLPSSIVLLLSGIASIYGITSRPTRTHKKRAPVG